MRSAAVECAPLPDLDKLPRTMMDKTLSVPDLEAFYDALAEGVDQATPARSELFLAKLALLLAREVADRRMLERCIGTALRDL